MAIYKVIDSDTKKETVVEYPSALHRHQILEEASKKLSITIDPNKFHNIFLIQV